MLRECVRHEPLAKIILHSEEFYKFFSFVEVSTFDIASDAFATFKDLLTKHKILCAQFLEQNYDKVRLGEERERCYHWLSFDDGVSCSVVDRRYLITIRSCLIQIIMSQNGSL